MSITPEQQAALRAPFPPEAVGKLPRVTCRACADARERVCDTHRKARCGECGNYMTGAHIHLDYVGHAATTDRLLQVDPAWTWRPFTLDERAAVAAVEGELWAWITVCGVERPCVGDGPTAKERISDMVRNGAMRFGVALDLWSKEPLGDDAHAGGSGPESPPRAARDRTAPTSWKNALVRFDHATAAGDGAAWLEELVQAVHGVQSLRELTSEQRTALLVGFADVLAELEAAGPLTFSTGVRATVAGAFARRFEGRVLRGPEWSLGPDEAARQARPATEGGIDGS